MNFDLKLVKLTENMHIELNEEVVWNSVFVSHNLFVF